MIKKVSLSYENMKLIRDKKFQMKDKFKIGDVIVLEFDKTTKTYNLSQILK